jgi:hypothetical protein
MAKTHVLRALSSAEAAYQALNDSPFTGVVVSQNRGPLSPELIIKRWIF